MRLLFVRHGEPDYAVDSLTKKGWREASLLADRLAMEEIADFYVSPLGRAQDTARVTLERLSRSAETLPWLQEFRARVINPCAPGSALAWDWSPGYWKEQPELHNRDAWRDNAVFQTGDAAQAYDETARGLDALLAKYGYIRQGHCYRVENGGSKATVALFCHFGITMVMLCHLLGLSPAVGLNAFFFAPASITTAVTEERTRGVAAFRLTGAGDVSHLTGAGEPASRSGLFREVYDDHD